MAQVAVIRHARLREDIEGRAALLFRHYIVELALKKHPFSPDVVWTDSGLAEDEVKAIKRGHES